MLKVLMSLLALVACATSASLPTAVKNKVVEITLQQRHKYGDGEFAFKHFEQHVGEVTQLLEKNGSVPMYNIMNLYYVADVTVGTPPQRFNVTMSSEFTDTWVVDRSLCQKPKEKEFCEKHHTYDGKKSSTYKKFGKFSMREGILKGNVVQDTLNMSGIVVPNQKLGSVTEFHPDIILNLQSVDGNVGLGYPEGSELKVNPVFKNMIEEGLIDKPIYSMYMTNCSCGCTCSKLFLGGVNPKYYKGDIVYANIIDKKKLAFKMDGASFGSKKMIPAITVYPSTGTTLTYGPKKYMDAINKAMGAVQKGCVWHLPCSKLSSMPDLYITMAGKELRLTSYQYTIKWTTGECVSPFVGNKGQKDVVAGATLLRGFYSVFDMEKDRIGFAQLK